MTCKQPDCDRPIKARGWCVKHWNRWYVHGDPTVVLRPWGRDALRGTQ